MACRINLRHDQTAALIPVSQSPNVTIFAPIWVKEALKILGQSLKGIPFEVRDGPRVLESFTLTENITLQQLQMITRVDPMNVTGVIYRIYYEPHIKDYKILLALRDLVRQCVIISHDETTHFGGYGCEREKQKIPVYVCDLAGLQFQQVYNSGRLVLIRSEADKDEMEEDDEDDPSPLPVGILDDIIFQNVVGEPKKIFSEVEADKTGRYIHKMDYSGRDGVSPLYFDKFAYRKFVSHDVILTGLALNKMASQNEHKVHFKFLKYGTGYFASNFGTLLAPLILPAVVDGLEILFEKHSPLVAIEHVEFPFYSKDEECLKRLNCLKEKYGLEYSFTDDDALNGNCVDKGRILATTNCADPHSPTGNEMGFGSVDAAIAENLKSRGNIFNPCLNKLIEGEFLEM